MKDSHGQTAQVAICQWCGKIGGMGECGHLVHATSSDYKACGHFFKLAPETSAIVKDYRAYTADEILHGILESTEQAGWGDPANLGHWLGAAQRWAKERA